MAAGVRGEEDNVNFKSTFGIFLAVLVSALTLAAKANEPPDAIWVERAVDGVLSTYDRESVLIVGELHGTEEAPLFIQGIAKKLADTGAQVVIGLEMSRQEQSLINEFLNSDGSAGAVAALLAGEFWRGNDGRNSQAILGLLDGIRVARVAGSTISVMTIDDEAFFDEGSERREGLAARIAELHQDPKYDIVVVLIGNYHARLRAPSSITSEGELLTEPPVPTAARITNVPITTMNVTACSGAFWSCRSRGSCGPIEISARCDAEELPLVEELDPIQQPYNLSLVLERFTPSPPAGR